jgi:diamine N-acetyltransferase
MAWWAWVGAVTGAGHKGGELAWDGRSIWRAEVEDAGEISALAGRIWRACYAGMLEGGQIEHMLERGYAEDALRREIERGEEEIYLFGTAAGALGYMGFCEGRPEGQVFLRRLYLVPEEQGKGIGQMVLRWMEEEVARRGLRRVWLRVNKGNRRAMRAYWRAGFVVDGAMVEEIGGGYVMDDYVMGKWIGGRCRGR